MAMRVAAAVLIGLVAVAGVAMAQKETRGVSKTEIVLGMHTDLSGPAATYGVSSSNAVMWLTSVDWCIWLRCASSVVTMAMPTLPPTFRIML